MSATHVSAARSFSSALRVKCARIASFKASSSITNRGGRSSASCAPDAGIRRRVSKLQIDGAFDVADLSRTLSISAVYRF
jgi:hypothetical protein